MVSYEDMIMLCFLKMNLIYARKICEERRESQDIKLFQGSKERVM